MTTNDSIFRAVGLNKQYNQHYILNDVSVDLTQGEILGIWGVNASAKTTLIKVLSGIVSVDTGIFYIENVPYSSISCQKGTFLGISAILGDEQLAFNMSAGDNIYLGSFQPKAFYTPWYHQKALEKEANKHLQHYQCSIDLNAKLQTLTVAERYIILTMRAVVRSAKVLLIDDCLSEMDRKEQQEFIRLLKQLSSEGFAILIASQNIIQLTQVCDSIQIIQDGYLSPKYHTKDENTYLTDVMKNRVLFPKMHLTKGDIIYQCSQLSYGNALKNISLEIHEGEIIGIIGASGSGKSTLAKVIAGHLHNTSGTTRINHRTVKIRNKSDARRHGIALISNTVDNNNLVPDMNLSDNILLGNYRQSSHRFLPFVISSTKETLISINLQDNLEMELSKSEQVKHLSNGTQKKIAFSRSIMSGAQLLLLDEPSVSIDNIGKVQIYNIINNLLLSKKAIILFSSNVLEVINMCERILILKDGEIVDEIISQETTADDLYKMIYTVN